MKTKLLLRLGISLSVTFFSCSGIVAAEVDQTSAQTTGQIYHDTKYGFQLTLPSGWQAREVSLDVNHYDSVFLTINNQRPGLAYEGWGGSWMCDNHATQLQPGEVYLSIGYASGPGGMGMKGDDVDEDLHSLLATNQMKFSSSGGESYCGLNFFKRGQEWCISAQLKEPITEENHQKILNLLQSFRFVDAPVNNASWAESLAWKQLPDEIRHTENCWLGWPTVGQWDEKSGSAMAGQRSVAVTNLGSAYSIEFSLQSIGKWRFTVATNGEVEAASPMVSVQSPPPARWPSDLPGTNNGTIDASWIAPYVQASSALGKITITWLATDGHVERQASVRDVNPSSGFVEIIGQTNVMEGINEDWRIVPRKTDLHPGSTDERYAKSTPDSRTFIYQYNPKPKMTGLDIYIHGKLVNTLSFFPAYGPSRQVVLNDDGSAALLIAKTNVPFDPNVPAKNEEALRDELSTAHHLGAQIVALNTNGEVRFKTDCGSAVWDPIVAPNGAGVLLRANDGTNPNTFRWFTEKGEQHSLDISPNPQCIGWIPQTAQSLFLTQLGFETTHVELIDWNAGKRLWDISLPGRGGEILAIGLTPRFIIFSVAEPYPVGTWHKVNESLLQSGAEWVKTFYAISTEDGKLVARWQGQFPHTYFSADRNYFLRLGDKLFYVTADEFTELNLTDVMAKTNGWQ